MNIFVLDDNMETSCQYYIDKHIVIIKEMNQLLCTTLNILDAKSKNIPVKEIRLHQFAPYKTTHINHPLQQWAMESSANFEWIIEMNRNLINEFQFRYEKKYYSIIREYQDRSNIKLAIANDIIATCTNKDVLYDLLPKDWHVWKKFMWSSNNSMSVWFRYKIN